MRKNEIKAAASEDLVFEALKAYAIACTNANLGLATKSINKHFDDLAAELIRRGLLTEKQAALLNS